MRFELRILTRQDIAAGCANSSNWLALNIMSKRQVYGTQFGSLCSSRHCLQCWIFHMKLETQFLNAEHIDEYWRRSEFLRPLLVITAGVKPRWMKYGTFYVMKNIPSNQIDIRVFVRIACSVWYKKMQKKEKKNNNNNNNLPIFLLFMLYFFCYMKMDRDFK